MIITTPATQTQWSVWLDADTCLVVSAPDADAARLEAQLQAWDVTGKWYHPEKVEAIQ